MHAGGGSSSSGYSGRSMGRDSISEDAGDRQFTDNRQRLIHTSSVG